MPVNAAQYSVLSAGSVASRLAGYQRRKMYAAFLGLGIAPADTILEIGATSDRTYDHSNYLVAWYTMANISWRGTPWRIFLPRRPEAAPRNFLQ